jgi:hypothetical protein
MHTMRTALLAVVAGLLIVACGQSDVAPQASRLASAPATDAADPQKPSQAPFDGTVTLSARLEGGGAPAVVGVTNLPDGTLLMVTLSRKQSAYLAQDKTTVSGGSFRAGPFSQEGSDLRPGKYTIEIGSPLTALQPTSVQAAFGGNGANLKGPFTGPSPIGGTVVDYFTQVEIEGTPNSALDTAARDKAKQDFRQWLIGACDDNCRFVKNIAITQSKPFDQDDCYRRCLAEISGH